MSNKGARNLFVFGSLFFFAIHVILTFDTVEQIDKRSPKITGDVDAGKQVWHKYDCIGCHTILGNGSYFAPDLTKTTVNKPKGLRVTPTERFGWGRHLLIMSSFMLGGIDVFPGLNIGELRGDRELYAHVSISRPLLGPIEGRLTASSGQAAFRGPTLPEGRWQVGGRIGLAAETPIGPIRVEYALARDERNGFFVRVGEWFCPKPHPCCESSRRCSPSLSLRA